MQVWKACPSPVCASKLLGCSQIIEASEATYSDYGISLFTFNFAVIWDYSDDVWLNVENVVNKVFENNNCEVTNFNLYENDDPDPKYKEFEVITADVTYACDNVCDYDKLVRDLRRMMNDRGYLVIGRSEFL